MARVATTTSTAQWTRRNMTRSSMRSWRRTRSSRIRLNGQFISKAAFPSKRWRAEADRRWDLVLAGQMIGVEGYVESAAAGLLAAINASRLVNHSELVVPPPETSLGSLIAYITDRSRRDFQPMNANYGLMPELQTRVRGRQKKLAMGERALRVLDDWIVGEQLLPTVEAVPVIAANS